ncbi:unnamed protein product [Macrosiphum euphorbiae]|uniref:Uncharacterized protein n=1 Tax=Macrosiphum euphorbiae TaxID=13131 RepID=A0AAV0Y0C2_9HEMI|nr:unnamed protein product [Macrosiphum euphorbiae]CAI6373041.1 unnamed protein product [Macrosiphum euphorbiae]CAI6373229.1 unnamed protein product [Macrosiphum euphorbiae]
MQKHIDSARAVDRQTTYKGARPTQQIVLCSSSSNWLISPRFSATFWKAKTNGNIRPRLLGLSAAQIRVRACRVTAAAVVYSSFCFFSAHHALGHPPWVG